MSSQEKDLNRPLSESELAYVAAGDGIRLGISRIDANARIGRDREEPPYTTLPVKKVRLQEEE